MYKPIGYLTSYLPKFQTEEKGRNKKCCLMPIVVSKSDINIVLLGESGVGKSTLINSIANYISNPSMEEIERIGVICLIPTSFSVIDKDFESKTVTLGSHRNEDLTLGNSSTQGALAYKFPYKKGSKLRLIDTPGIGDSRGVEKDRQNFENILSYIRQFKHLHGIWILLKPDQTILNSYFKFCLTYLFSRLEKSATSNICFVFTNSRGSHYKPRDTLPLLKRVLSEIKENPPFVEIRCLKNNIFCLDNEGFKYLVAANQGVQFDTYEEEDFRKSFKISVEACLQLMNYVSTLTPHDIKKTSSVNEARRLIVDLTKPLIEVADQICKQKIILERREKIITDKNISNNELQKRLKRLQDDIENNKLTSPIFVCTEPTCSEEYTYEDVTRYCYHQECTLPFYTKVIPSFYLEKLGTPEFSPCLIACGLVGTVGGGLAAGLASLVVGGPLGTLTAGESASIGASSGGALGSLLGVTLDKFLFDKCTVCQCPYSKHKSVYYDPDIVKFMKKEEAVKQNLKSEEQTLQQQRQLVQELHVIIAEYENEKKIITKSVAKFAVFLEKNAIVLHSSSYIDYIDTLIENEESFGANRDLDKIKRFKNLKKEYEVEKNIFTTNLATTKDYGINANTLTPEEIFTTVNKLRSLKYSGKTIINLQKQQELLKTSNSMEYCYDLP